jgi:hypothetical protein
MATFVECIDGNFANLDRVDGIRRIRGNDYCYELLVLDGNKPPLVLGRINAIGLLDVKRLQGPVLPAQPNTKALVLSGYEEGGEAKVWQTEVEVLGWRVMHDNTAQPITARCYHFEDETFLLIMPDGKVFNLDGEEVDIGNVEAEVLARYQARMAKRAAE